MSHPWMQKMEIEYQKQLRQPYGRYGKVVGSHLYEGNKGVIEKTINQISPARDLTIIDVGCGPGYSLELLANRFPTAKIIGIDPSPEMIEFAKEKNYSNIGSKRIEIIQGETPNLSIKTNIADYLLLINVVYFWKNPEEHFVDIFRIIKPGGRLLIYMTDKKSLESKIDVKDGVFYMYTKRKVIDYLTKVGFYNIKSKKIIRKIGQTGFILNAMK